MKPVREISAHGCSSSNVSASVDWPDVSSDEAPRRASAPVRQVREALHHGRAAAAPQHRAHRGETLPLWNMRRGLHPTRCVVSGCGRGYVGENTMFGPGTKTNCLSNICRGAGFVVVSCAIAIRRREICGCSCQTIVIGADTLRDHQICKHAVAPKQHCCQVCGKEFSKKVTLIRHMRFHTGASQTKCDSHLSICGLVLVWNIHLNRQVKLSLIPFGVAQVMACQHTQWRLFKRGRTDTELQAAVRSFGFSEKFSLAGEKPFPCQHCGRPYSINYKRKLHEQSNKCKCVCVCVSMWISVVCVLSAILDV